MTFCQWTFVFLWALGPPFARQLPPLQLAQPRLTSLGRLQQLTWLQKLLVSQSHRILRRSDQTLELAPGFDVLTSVKSKCSELKKVRLN